MPIIIATKRDRTMHTEAHAGYADELRAEGWTIVSESQTPEERRESRLDELINRLDGVQPGDRSPIDLSDLKG